MALKVVHVVDSLAEQAGAAAISLRGLIEISPSLDMDATVVACPAEGSVSAVGEHLNGSADLIHLHGLDSGTARDCARQAHRLGIPYVVSPLGRLTDPVDRPEGLVQRVRGWFESTSWVSRAAGVVGVNQHEARSLQPLVGGGGVEVLPAGLCTGDYSGETAEPADMPPRSEERVLLLLGPVHPTEGCVALLKAFAELGLATNGWMVVLAGPECGDYRKMLEAAVRRKGGADRVRFAAAADLVTQRAWLQRASLLVAPSLQHRSPVSILQAAATGVPALASSLVAPPELVEVIQVCEPQRSSLKDALRKLLTCSDEERRQLGARARQRCVQACDWSVVGPRYSEFYRTVARPAGASVIQD